MDEFKIVIPIFAIILVLVTYISFKKLFNPLSIIILWWSGWLFISNFSFTGLFIPSGYTQFLVLLMLIGFTMGGMISYSPLRTDVITDISNKEFYSKYKKIYKLNLFIFPIVAYYLYRAVEIFLSEGLLGYRNAVFEEVGGVEGSSLLFKYASIEYLYNNIISPVIFLSLILSTIFYILFNDKKFILISITLVIMEAALRLGRFPFYYIIVFFLLSTWFLYDKFGQKSISFVNFRNIKKKAFKIIVFVIILLVLITFMSILRTDDDENHEGIADMLQVFLIDYHTVGFTLLDAEITDDNSILNKKMSYGRSILGGLDDPVIILLRRFDKSLISTVREAATERYKHIIVGYNDGFPKTSNAFYTVISSLYIDGREPFILYMSAFFGFVLSCYYRKWLMNGFLSDLAILLYFTHFALFSIFMSLSEGSMFWTVLFILIFLNKKQYKRANRLKQNLIQIKNGFHGATI
jgi:oligosaccharide repeat unit polymerase